MMKKLKFLFVLLMAIVILPFAVFAEDEVQPRDGEAVEESKEVNVYLFRGEGCPHCQEAEEWFKSIEEEYGSFFNVIDYETWYNEENAALMERVAAARGEEADGVPYIIIGNKSWAGFAEDYESEIIAQIKSEFEQDVSERYDIMKLLPELGTAKASEKEKSTGSDVVALIIILVVAAGVGFGIYKARTSTN